MRILLLVDCYLPQPTASSQLIHDLARALMALGHEPVVATPDPDASAPCVLGEEDGFPVLRVRTGRVKGVGRIVRALNEWRLSGAIWRAAGEYFRAHPCEGVVYYSPTIFFGPLVARLRRLWGARSYLILRDIFPHWAVEAGVMGKGPHYAFFRHYERLQYRVADVIGVQSPANLEYFEGIHRDDSGGRGVEVLYNWAPPGDASAGGESHVRRDLGLDGKVVFFYGGNIGVAQAMDQIVDLAEDLADEPSAYFLIVGEGSEAARLKARVTEAGLSNIAFYPPVSQERYRALVGEFDVGIISLDARMKSHNYPGKLLSYLQQGLPVLAAVNPGNDLRQILEENEAGLVCVSGDRTGLRAHALRLTRDGDIRRRLGENSRRLLLTTFCVSRVAERIVAGLTRRA